ncbi:hypothetical protein JB92DRAFT_1017113 [Gautieria morchelliformis]|nr:hypothetical protein JB92DRAFT_1017113 [Gautieria morchelliformis]
MRLLIFVAREDLPNRHSHVTTTFISRRRTHINQRDRNRGTITSAGAQTLLQRTGRARGPRRPLQLKSVYPSGQTTSFSGGWVLTDAPGRKARSRSLHVAQVVTKSRICKA